MAPESVSTVSTPDKPFETGRPAGASRWMLAYTFWTAAPSRFSPSAITASAFFPPFRW